MVSCAVFVTFAVAPLMAMVTHGILLCEAKINEKEPGASLDASGSGHTSGSWHECISVVQAPSMEPDSSEVEESIIHSKTPEPLTIGREPKEFIEQYVARYVRKDVESFLSLFSPRSVQNGKYGFEEIGKIYSDLFDKSQEIRYQLYNILVKTHDEGALVFGLYYLYVAEVTAHYRMDQVLKNGGKHRTREGDIGWVLVRQNGVLRVLSLYDSYYADVPDFRSDDSSARLANGRDPDRGENRAGDGIPGESGPGEGSTGGGGSGPGDGGDGGGSDSDSGSENGGKGKAKGHDPDHSKGKGKGKGKGK
jgi:hypothetical protein